MLVFLRRVLATIGVVLLVVVSCALMAIPSFRNSLFWLALSSSIVLPIATWLGLRDIMAAMALGTAAFLALSPVYFTVRHSGRIGWLILPVSHGRFCKADTACYGCAVSMNDPKFAVVFDY